MGPHRREDTLQKWHKWLEEMKKKDEKEKMEEMHQHKVAEMIKSAEGSEGLLHKNLQYTDPEEGRRGCASKARRMSLGKSVKIV